MQKIREGGNFRLNSPEVATPLEADIVADKKLRPAARQCQDLFDKCYSYTRTEDARKEGVYPYFTAISSSEGSEVMVGKKKCIMIGSNNYLGLTHDPRVLEAAEKTARKYGTGCTGSRLLNGTLDLHEKLELELAKFVQREEAIVFSTGFHSNVGLISTLVGRHDAIVMDKLVHASVVDGARMAGATTYRYQHNDMNDLRAQLDKIEPGKPILIAADGLFSMEGDLVPLPQLLKIARDYPAKVFIDEAHSFGVIGPTGAGVCEKFGLIDEVDLVMGTFSKSFASIGGFVAGQAQVMEYVKHHARPMIFSAAIPPYAIGTVLKCLEIIKKEPERRERLDEIQKYMKKELDLLGFDTGDSESPVIPIIVGDFRKTLIFWRSLLEAGIFTNAVIAPAVPHHSNRIRTSYMATHTDSQLDRVLSTMKIVGKKLDII